MINFLTIKILLHKNGYTEADVCVRRIEKKKKKENQQQQQQQQQNKQNNTKKCKNSYEIYPEPIIDK